MTKIEFPYIVQRQEQDEYKNVAAFKQEHEARVYAMLCMENSKKMYRILHHSK